MDFSFADLRFCRPKQGQSHLTGGLLTAFGVVDNGRLAWFFYSWAVEERRRGSTLQSAGTKIATWRARKPHLSRPSIRPEGGAPWASKRTNQAIVYRGALPSYGATRVTSAPQRIHDIYSYRSSLDGTMWATTTLQLPSPP